MSKFQSTISVVAALASIFGAGAAGFKLAQDNQVKPSSSPAEEVNTKYEQHITELQQQISGLQQQLVNTNSPPAVSLPQSTQVKQVAPVTPQLPPPLPPNSSSIPSPPQP